MIVQKVREAERDRQYQEFKDRIGDIVNGIVKRVEYGSVIVDLGRGEAIIRRDEMLPARCSVRGQRDCPPIPFPGLLGSHSAWYARPRANAGCASLALSFPAL